MRFIIWWVGTVLFILAMVLGVGGVLPMLLSAANDEAVLLGYGIATLLLPVLTFYYCHFTYKTFKKESSDA